MEFTVYGLLFTVFEAQNSLKKVAFFCWRNHYFPINLASPKFLRSGWCSGAGGILSLDKNNNDFILFCARLLSRWLQISHAQETKYIYFFSLNRDFRNFGFAEITLQLKQEKDEAI